MVYLGVMSKKEDSFYQFTVYDLIGGVVVLSAAWYFDLHGLIASITDPLVLALLDLLWIG